MDIEVVRAIDGLRGLGVRGLQEKYREVFGRESKSTHKQFLFRRIAWQIQAQAEGDLSQRARQRAGQIADEADVRSGGKKGFWSWTGRDRTSAPPLPLEPGEMLGCRSPERCSGAIIRAATFW